MDYKHWLDFAPAALSAIAGVAAAVAAFNSLKVSRESKLIAEKSALSIAHSEAARKLSEVSDCFAVQTVDLHHSAMAVWTDFPREVEQYDCRKAGGEDPRPIRHVVSNVAEMLERYSSDDGRQYRSARHYIFSVIRNGMGKLSNAEYEHLLRRADGSCVDFESTLGPPNRQKSISDSPAFRWGYYQLERRVGTDMWSRVWINAWSPGGQLRRFSDELEQVKPMLENHLSSLESEKRRLKNTVFPIDDNEYLYRAYSDAIAILDGLLEFARLDLFDGYVDDPHPSDLIPLVISSCAAAIFTARAIDNFKRTRE
ncbi:MULTISPECIES: hypothetical protein [unclassified Marinobacter]|uniref:hypothetical protein n=1 Tax=unclassified Marinobacter TaxID=83889 RepID=UPI001268FC2A|nr:MULTISPECIES: hypothetical protein [unclassified Marinobacter]QFS88095.1 hypothetical protein FIV08_14770 [Marinobacter sp. THAF197a]QFT51880.1 hypothetical protein FIU96_14680 [Marinobacter sp. THAF39]